MTPLTPITHIMPMFVTLSALVSMLRLLERRWERTWAP